MSASGGSTGVLGLIGSDRTDLAGLQAGFGGNLNSITSDPLFNSTTNLQPQIGSPVIGAGIAGTGITTDILGAPRSTGTAPAGPTMGAYETGIDSAGPSIVYTPLGNTTVTTNRDVSATITDPSNVASGANSPRIYYKKSTDAGYVSNQCAGSYLCTIDYSLLGAPAAGGDIIQYFIVAQDVPGNVSANPSAGFAGTSVNAVTTPPTSPNAYRIEIGRAHV